MISKFGFIVLSISLSIMLVILPGCKKKDDSISGNWQGTLTTDLSHQHEEYQVWEEVIPHENAPDEVIEHVEHITWTFTNTITIEFAFNIDSPLYEARISGTGTARQNAQFTPPSQCGLTALNAPGFNVSVFGSIGTDTFTLGFVPDSIPVLNVSLTCQNVLLTSPTYATALLGIISGIRTTVPAQNGITSGGSGTISAGSGYSSMAYIYNLTLTQR
jgi:hypothetical protein